MREQEVGQVIDSDGHLQTIFGRLAEQPHTAGVVDKHVETGVAVPEPPSQVADLLLR